MIELYCRDDDQQGKRIEASLKELRAAHKVIIVPPGQELEVALPAIRDSKEWFSEEAEITKFLENLAEMLSSWTWFAGDACYIDDDGEVC